jgi:hypothetical protein
LRGYYQSSDRDQEHLKFLNFARVLPKIYCGFAFVFAIRREILKVGMFESQTKIIIKNKITGCKSKS